MLTAAGLARQLDISRQAVSRRIKQLIKVGLTVERNAKNHVILVNVDDFTRLARVTADPSKKQARARRPDPDPEIAAYNVALAKKTAADAARSELKLEQERGRLLRADDVAEAAAHCAARIVTFLERPIHQADHITTLATTAGSNAVRRHLREVVREQREAIANALDDLGGGAGPGRGEDGGGEGNA
jgi:biotin operon repressor